MANHSACDDSKPSLKQVALWVGIAPALLVVAGCFRTGGGAGLAESGSTAGGRWWTRFWSVGANSLAAGSTVGEAAWVPEAGSVIPIPSDRPEAGSVEAGSVVEAGSRTGEAGSTTRLNSERFRGGIDTPQAGDETGLRFRDVLHAGLYAVLCLVGLAAAFLLFRLGMRPPFAKDLWWRRMNLASEIGQQMDVFLAAAYREEWDGCRRALAALNEMNGQRAILLGDAANRRVLEFMTAAAGCRANRDDADCLPDLRIKQVHALSSLRREIGQRDELSETLLKSLRDTRHLYQPLRAPDTGQG